MEKHCYILTTSSIHPDGIPADDGMLHAIEPDYRQVISNANLRRRMSHIIKMGVAAGMDCLHKGGNMQVDAIITATGLGCLQDTERFLCAITDNDETLLNPLSFIQSTFNVVGAQIALLTENHSYNNTYSHRGLSFESALLDGMMTIYEGNNRVLVGGFDEVTQAQQQIYNALNLFNGIVPGEGAHFFLLSKEKSDVELIGIKTKTGKLSKRGLLILLEEFLTKYNVSKNEVDALVTGENPHAGDVLCETVRTWLAPRYHITYKEHVGEYATASAFGLFRGVELLKQSDATFLLCYNHYLEREHSLILLRKW